MDFTSSYNILAKISAGPIATVYKAEFILESTTVAIKIFNHNRRSVSLSPQRVSSVSHTNLLHVHLFFAPNDGRFWAVMPFLPAGSLRSIMLYSFPYGLPEPCIAVVLRQVLRALAYLDRLGEFHGDVKPGNIVIDNRSSTVVMLADFGVSESNYDPTLERLIMDDDDEDEDEDDVAYWKAPENEYTPAADIWSFGATALELAYGGPPLSQLDPIVSELMRIKIRKRFGWSRDDERRYKIVMDCCHKSFSQDFAAMVSLCLNPNPIKRPSAQTLLNHPFFSAVADATEDSDFLQRNLLRGLPRIEKRLKEARYFDAGDPLGHDAEHQSIIDVVFNRLEKFNLVPEISAVNNRFEEADFDAGDSGRQNVEHQRVIGWKFDVVRLKVDPVLKTPPMSRRPAREPTTTTTDEHYPASGSVIRSVLVEYFNENATREIEFLDREWHRATAMILQAVGEATNLEEDIVARMAAIQATTTAERARRTELEEELKSLRDQLLGPLARA